MDCDERDRLTELHKTLTLDYRRAVAVLNEYARELSKETHTAISLGVERIRTHLEQSRLDLEKHPASSSRPVSALPLPAGSALNGHHTCFPRRDSLNGETFMTTNDDRAWYNQTPPIDHSLEMFGQEAPEEAPEAVELTREEYIHLKRCLAELRGIEHNLNESEEE